MLGAARADAPACSEAGRGKHGNFAAKTRVKTSAWPACEQSSGEENERGAVGHRHGRDAGRAWRWLREQFAELGIGDKQTRECGENQEDETNFEFSKTRSALESHTIGKSVKN